MGVVPTFWSYLIVFGMAALPILEVKAAIPAGIGMGIPFWLCFVIAVFGSFFPSPFIVVLFRKILQFFIQSKIKLFQKFGEWLKKHTEKRGEAIQSRKFTLLAVFLLAAIPIPVLGGVWTSSAVAGFLNIRLRSAMTVIFIGNLIASIIILIISHIIII